MQKDEKHIVYTIPYLHGYKGERLIDASGKVYTYDSFDDENSISLIHDESDQTKLIISQDKNDSQPFCLLASQTQWCLGTYISYSAMEKKPYVGKIIKLPENIYLVRPSNQDDFSFGNFINSLSIYVCKYNPNNKDDNWFGGMYRTGWFNSSITEKGVLTYNRQDNEKIRMMIYVRNGNEEKIFVNFGIENQKYELYNNPENEIGNKKICVVMLYDIEHPDKKYIALSKQVDQNSYYCFGGNTNIPYLGIYDVNDIETLLDMELTPSNVSKIKNTSKNDDKGATFEIGDVLIMLNREQDYGYKDIDIIQKELEEPKIINNLNILKGCYDYDQSTLQN